jgi:hypothetical protein
MELLVIGSGAAYPDKPGTASSCYVVSHGGAALCLDMGQGAFAGLAGRLEPADLAAVASATSTPTTSSTSSRSAITCATSSTRRAACA